MVSGSARTFGHTLTNTQIKRLNRENTLTTFGQKRLIVFDEIRILEINKKNIFCKDYGHVV